MPRVSALTFDRFIATAESAEALADATTFALEQPGAPHLLLLYGAPGVGKTHLLQSIVHSLGTRRGWASVVQTTGSELIQDLLDALRRDENVALRGQHTQAALIVVDDLHVLAGKPVTQAEIARLLKAVVERGARVACAAGCAPEDIPVFTETLLTLPGAKLAEIGRPGRDGMRRILAAIATAAGLTLSARTVVSIAEQCHGDVRCALGALARLRFEQTLPMHAEQR